MANASSYATGKNPNRRRKERPKNIHTVMGSFRRVLALVLVATLAFCPYVQAIDCATCVITNYGDGAT